MKLGELRQAVRKTKGALYVYGDFGDAGNLKVLVQKGSLDDVLAAAFAEDRTVETGLTLHDATLMTEKDVGVLHGAAQQVDLEDYVAEKAAAEASSLDWDDL